MNDAYLEIIKPQNLRPKIKDFGEWLDLGTLEDLKCALRVFETEEMFEDCVIIKNKIDKYERV
jgi:hypothetical protein